MQSVSKPNVNFSIGGLATAWRFPFNKGLRRQKYIIATPIGFTRYGIGVIVA